MQQRVRVDFDVVFMALLTVLDERFNSGLGDVVSFSRLIALHLETENITFEDGIFALPGHHRLSELVFANVQVMDSDGRQ